VTERREIRVDGVPPSTAPLSQGIAAGDFVFISGQVPRDPKSQAIPEGIEAQTHQVLRNIERVLAAAGCTLNDVVKVTAPLADLTGDRAGFNAAYTEHFREPLPARTTWARNWAAFLSSWT
jgi:2-iminobutanoate/2-iminopropanoate deaminase